MSNSITKKTFDSYCDNKTIAIVGNAKQPLLSSTNGALIDGHDIVVRFNQGLPKPKWNKHIGEKTDIWVCSLTGKNNQAKMHKQALKRKFTMYVMRHHWLSKGVPQHLKAKNNLLDSANLIPEIKENAYVVPRSYYEKTKQLLSAKPSSGLLVLRYFVEQIKYKHLTVVGFDFFQSSQIYRQQLIAKIHNASAEQCFISQLLKNAPNVHWIQASNASLFKEPLPQKHLASKSRKNKIKRPFRTTRRLYR